MRPLVIVAAIARNGAIGRNNALPWTMPGDLARFRELTVGRPMLMGRRTFEAIGRNLPGRESIVLTRRPTVAAAGVHHVADLDAALAIADDRAAVMGAGEIALVGGTALFAGLMPRCARLALTFVDCAPEADTFFPPIDPYRWREAARVYPPRHPDDEADCVFVDYLPAGP